MKRGTTQSFTEREKRQKFVGSWNQQLLTTKSLLGVPRSRGVYARALRDKGPEWLAASDPHVRPQTILCGLDRARAASERRAYAIEPALL